MSLYKDPAIRELERASEVADARLGVAEDLVWPIATLLALAMGSKWGWVWGLASFAIAFYFVRRPYVKAAAAAEDAFHRAAQLGKYCTPSPQADGDE